MKGKENAAVKSNVKLLEDTVKKVPKSDETLHYVVEQSLKQINLIKIKAVTFCSTHKIDQQETDG